MIFLIIERSSEWKDGLRNGWKIVEPWDSWKLYNMSYEIAKTNLITDFQGLQSPKYLPNANTANPSIGSGGNGHRKDEW